MTGRLSAIQYPSGRTETFSYDRAGNLLGITDSSTGLSVAYTYDALNRIATETQQGRTLTYGYDENGNRISLSVSDIGDFAYSYDLLNRLISITDPDIETTSFADNAADLRTRITYGNDSYSDYAYDEVNRLTAITHHKSDDSVLAGHGYTYDAMGNRLTETDENGTLVVSYSYDDTYKLLIATYLDTG